MTSLSLALALLLCLLAMPHHHTAADETVDSHFQPLAAQGYELVQFTLNVQNRKVTAVVASPPADQLADDPLLLVSIGGASTHLLPPNDQPAKFFWKRGHRVVSFGFEGSPGDLNEYRENILRGPDPFANFIQDAQAVIDHCIERKLARPDGIVVSGISRFAYLGFRLMAVDDRLRVGAGFAPVTDWRDLSEFHPAAQNPKIVKLAISNFADQLAGKRIFLCIGSHDERVNTRRCAQFFLDLVAANQKQGHGPELVDFLITTDPTHTCGDASFETGMEIVLTAALKTQKK